MTNTSYQHSNKKQKRFNWIPIVIMALLITVIVWVVYQFKDEKRFAVVKLYGDGLSMNLSKSYNLTQFSSGNKSKAAVLTEEADLLGINGTFIYFTDVKNDSMEVNDKGDSLTFINGKICSILLSEKEDLLPWFRIMKAADIANLKTIHFTSQIPGSYIPYIKEIARLKPNTSLVIEEDDSLNLLELYFKETDFFTPRFVKISTTQNNFSLLSNWKDVECLYINILDSITTQPLPAMPALKECIVYADDTITIAPSFFNNNRQLKKLTILSGISDYTLLQPLDHLQELSINNTVYNANVTSLRNKLNNLSVLIMAGTYPNIDSLALCKKLRWLGLPENTSQQQFNTITAKLPDLQILEITGSDSITNMSALQQMPNLNGLVITDTVTDKQTLYGLKNLRYLSIPQNNKADSIYLQALEKALPGCIIVPNSGACLGSGWLLLLVPLVLLCSVIIQKVLLLKVGHDKF